MLMGLLTLACLSPPPVPSQLYRPPSKKEHSRRLDAYESWLRKEWGSKDAPETCRGGGGGQQVGFAGDVREGSRRLGEAAGWDPKAERVQEPSGPVKHCPTWCRRAACPPSSLGCACRAVSQQMLVRLDGRAAKLPVRNVSWREGWRMRCARCAERCAACMCNALPAGPRTGPEFRLAASQVRRG